MTKPVFGDSGEELKRVQPIEYLGFEIEIGQGRDGEYPVRAISVAGQAQATMRLPFDVQAMDSELEALRAAMRSTDQGRRRRDSAEQQTRAFGQMLFDALFRNQIRVLYNSIRHQATEESKVLRLQLAIQPPELIVLPWEVLYDRQLGQYICQSASVVRYVAGPEHDWPSIATPPLRILGMIVNPGDGPPPEAEAEKQHLEEAISRLRALELVELQWVEGQSARALVQALGLKEWHVLHFVGDGGLDRGTGEGFVVVDDDAGQSRRLSASQLKWLLSKCKSLQMIWLSACSGALGDRPDRFSGTATLLVQKGIPAVLSAQLGTNSPAVEAFIEAFYAALAAEMPLDLAVTRGRMAKQEDGSHTPSWSAPVLHTQLPDLRLFDRQAIMAAAQRSGDEALSSDDFERALNQYTLATELGAEPDSQEKRALARSALDLTKAAEESLNAPAADVETQTEAILTTIGGLARLQEQLPESTSIQALLVRLREELPGLRGRLWQQGQALLEIKTIGLTLEQRFRRMEDSVRLLEKAKSLNRGKSAPLDADLAKARRRLDYLQSAQERAQAGRGRRLLRYGIIVVLIIAVLVAIYFVIQLLPLSELFGGGPTEVPAMPTQATTAPPTETLAATLVAAVSPTAFEETTGASGATPSVAGTTTRIPTFSPSPTSTPTATRTPSPEAITTEPPTATPQPTDTATPQPTDTATPPPSDTVAPAAVQAEPTSTSTPSPTDTPQPPISYAVPVLVEPSDYALLSQAGGSDYALRWTWDGSLQDGEWFDVRIWTAGMPHLGMAWTRAPVFEFDICFLVSGEYYWSVAVVRGEEGLWYGDLSPEAQPRQFAISRDDLWCQLRGY